jgi:uncharacterized damage-inducible protein DinB
VTAKDQRFPDGLFPGLARYNRWMNDKLYEAAAGLDDADRRRDLGAFFGSLHLTLSHLLICDRAWLARLSGKKEEGTFCDARGERIVVTSLGHDVYPDFALLTKERRATDERIASWVDGIGAAELEATVAYKDSRGNPHTHTMWWGLIHMFNHQTHHRGQATTLLKQLGVDPGVTDLIAMLRGS